MEFDTIAHARIWMRGNQKGRRNLSSAWLIELELGNKADLLEIGKAKRVETLKQNATVLSENDKTESPPVNTQKAIAKAAGVSTGQVGMAEQVKKNCCHRMTAVSKNQSTTPGKPLPEPQHQARMRARQERRVE
jgi:hypothetical protein